MTRQHDPGRRDLGAAPRYHPAAWHGSYCDRRTRRPAVAAALAGGRRRGRRRAHPVTRPTPRLAAVLLERHAAAGNGPALLLDARGPRRRKGNAAPRPRPTPRGARSAVLLSGKGKSGSAGAPGTPFQDHAPRDLGLARSRPKERTKSAARARSSRARGAQRASPECVACRPQGLGRGGCPGAAPESRRRLRCRAARGAFSQTEEARVPVAGREQPEPRREGPARAEPPRQRSRGPKRSHKPHRRPAGSAPPPMRALAACALLGRGGAGVGAEGLATPGRRGACLVRGRGLSVLPGPFRQLRAQAPCRRAAAERAVLAAALCHLGRRSAPRTSEGTGGGGGSCPIP
ncbi:serine/arginine repetitive matrix protein 1-like [Ochotona curzoniae]|uniref:serine/arginine repetitive matrix protein 1-like n=1 Tax=Ochotona curzoniae TaxID=130825 RepID=UPI001B352105|nr:serine/arginine repetitive matrix protein 1-like [Ochotona curzoniae]